jgi:hypothetical protein
MKRRPGDEHVWILGECEFSMCVRQGNGEERLRLPHHNDISINCDEERQ